MVNRNSVTSTSTNERPVPFVKWVGGKRQLLNVLTERMPSEYGDYYEPFLGGGAMFFHTLPTFAVLSDINSELINTYAVIKFHPTRLIHALGALMDKQSGDYEAIEEFYYELRNADRQEDYEKWTDIEKAARFIYLNKTGFNGLYRVNSKGQFNVPFGKRIFSERLKTYMNINACSVAMRNTVLQNESFESILSRVTSGDFVYLDPPYIPDGISSTFTAYTKTGFGMTDQERLRDMCKELDRRGVRWMLSNSSAPVMEELYSGFNIEYVDANRSVGALSESRKTVKETIVRNYE